MSVEQLVSRDELVTRLNRRPFLPFAVQLADGQRKRIMRVGQMGIGQTIGTIGEITGDNARHIKLAEIIALEDI